MTVRDTAMRSIAAALIAATVIATPAAADPSLSGLVLWLDASDASTLTLSGGSVTQWRDKSGNAINAGQSTPGARPAYTTGITANGGAAVVFDGINDMLSLMQGPTLTQFSVVAMWNLLTAPSGYSGAGFVGSYYPMFFGSGNINAPGKYAAVEIGTYSTGDANGVDIAGGFGSDSRATLTGISAAGSFHINSFTSADTHSTQVWQDGVAANMSTTGGNAAWNFTLGNATGDGPLGLGGVNWGSQGLVNYSNLALSALLVYDHVLTPQERQASEDYITAQFITAAPEPISAAPEPMSAALLAAGLASLALLRRRNG